MEEQDCLYLAGRKDVDLWVPAESLIALFTLQYCHNPATKVVIVEPKNYVPSPLCNDGGPVDKPSSESRPWFPVEMKRLDFDIKAIEEGDCPVMLKHCMLPAVLMASQPWCVAGLCSSLRFVLGQTVAVYPRHYCHSLLGFRGGCLQACAEVSVWTRFCEVESVKALENLGRGCNASSGVSEMPAHLMRYEHHLQHPPILHNALKRKQEYIKNTVQDKDEQRQLCQKKLKDLPELEHKYAEGLDMTLADIMLYATFHLIISKVQVHASLEDVCPYILKWHKLISSNGHVQRALPVLHEALVCLSPEEKVESSFCMAIPDVPRESIYKSDQERYNPRCKMYTHQGEIDKALRILETAAVRPAYSIHPAVDVSLPWSSFPPAVSPQEGQLPFSRLQRKCQQLENVVSAVKAVAKKGDAIVDFCAGGGHVGIVVAHCLPDCKVLLVENKEASLVRAKKRVEALKLKNVEFVQCNLDYFKGRFNVGVCLHACGVATDLVLSKCQEQRAAFICSPCCYGGLQPNHVLSYPRSRAYRDLSLSLAEYLTLGHAADQTHDETNPKTEQGQLCMRLIDTDRLILAQELSYTTRLVLMQPKSCSPKNHLLIGVPN